MPTAGAIETFEKPLFVKSSLADDPDWTDPDEDPPDEDDRVHPLSWALAGGVVSGPQVHKLLLGVTFRNGSGVEKPGTFQADILKRSPVSASASTGVTSSTRASWKKIGEVGTAGNPHPSEEYIVLDVGGDGHIAIRLYNITAADATEACVSAQQWGGT
jgi:hypothetical protein